MQVRNEGQPQLEGSTLKKASWLEGTSSRNGPLVSKKSAKKELLVRRKVDEKNPYYAWMADPEKSEKLALTLASSWGALLGKEGSMLELFGLQPSDFTEKGPFCMPQPPSAETLKDERLFEPSARPLFQVSAPNTTESNLGGSNPPTDASPVQWEKPSQAEPASPRVEGGLPMGETPVGVDTQWDPRGGVSPFRMQNTW